jgi:MFS family permease
MGGAIISDCWRAEERGRGMGIYQLAQVLGPTIGPIGKLFQYIPTWLR